MWRCEWYSGWEEYDDWVGVWVDKEDGRVEEMEGLCRNNEIYIYDYRLEKI